MNGRYGCMIIVTVMILSACNSRHIAADKVPSIVRNSLLANYPAVQKVDWEKFKNYYEVEADLNDTTELTLQINPAGTIIMRKQDLAVDQLPAPVTAYINNNYTSYGVDDVEQLEKDSKIYFQVELNAKGKKDVTLVFAQDGTLEKNVPYWN
jgi:hypothetical protein